MDRSQTTENSWTGKDSHDPARPQMSIPGLVLIFSAGQALSIILPLERGPLRLGRGLTASGFTLSDTRMSRRHAEVEVDGSRWTVRDLESRNGTAIDGEAIQGTRTGEAFTILRTGASIFLFTDDTRRFQEGLLSRGAAVLGPSLIVVWEKIRRAANNGNILHITGETGTGKELAARAFHETGPRRKGPFVPVSGPNIPENLAESTLFGTCKGAFTGADKTDGYVRSADKGTLFIDEVGDLSTTLQAKLLRVLETKHVTPIGATQPTPVDFSLCTATNKDLRAEVVAGRMREDFFFRVSTPAVRLPPLRERLEEIPHLIARALADVSKQHQLRTREAGSSSAKMAPCVPHVSLIETCLRRRWPGNVRELLLAVHAAAQEALGEGVASVQSQHLPSAAGLAFTPALPVESPAVASLSPSFPSVKANAPPSVSAEIAQRQALARQETLGSSAQPASKHAKVRAGKGASAPATRQAPPGRKAVPASALPDDGIGDALRRANNNITAASRELGVHRTQLRRWIKRHFSEGLAEVSNELTVNAVDNRSSSNTEE